MLGRAGLSVIGKVTRSVISRSCGLSFFSFRASLCAIFYALEICSLTKRIL